MTSNANTRTFDIGGALVVALVALAVYAVGLGTADLNGDPLKYAIDVSYPHPPLFRGAMWWAQALFGQTAFWARLPMVMLGACAGGLGWMLLRYAGLSRTASGVLLAGLLLTPSWLTIVREGYLGTGLAASWLLGLVGVVQWERRRTAWALLCILVAVVGGLWGQIQNLWLLPALATVALHQRHQWLHLTVWERILFVLIPVNVGIWGMYVLTNPLIVGDILFFASDRPHAGVLVPSIPIMTASLVIFGIWGYRLASRVRVPWALWEWAAAALCATVVPLVLFNPVDWYSPYVWACLVAALAAGARVLPTGMQTRVAVGMAAVLAIGTWNAWSVAQPYRTAAPAIQAHIGDTTDLIILGAHGYEWEYYLTAVNHRLPADAGVRSTIPFAIAPKPHTLSAEEQTWAAQQEHVADVGTLQIYAITNP